VPASLIKKCIGKRDYEESYEIDLINNTKNLFLGKSNLSIYNFNENNTNF
jgi:hypothetical protein